MKTPNPKIGHRDVVARIKRSNRGRDPERLALKYDAMEKDALSFFRGTCHLYSEDWPTVSRLNEAPVVWVCGDLHIENVGAYKGDNRLVYFDIADFDEAFLAPCTRDLARLVTSGLIAAKTVGWKRKPALALCATFHDAYTLAIRDGKARWIERSTADGLIGSLLRSVERRTRVTFIAKRTEIRGGKRRLRIDGKHTLAIDKGDRDRVKRFMRTFAASRPNPKFFRMLDVARRIAGTGSLGLERYTILVEGRGTVAGHFLLDLKFAAPSALAPYITQPQPRWKSDAERVVRLERRMQAITPALLDEVSIDSKPYVIRELMPSEDKLDLRTAKGTNAQLNILARNLGYLTAWSQLRSGGRDGSATIDELIAFARGKWRKEVLEYAEEYRTTASRDWKEFREAYRDGALNAG